MGCFDDLGIVCCTASNSTTTSNGLGNKCWCIDSLGVDLQEFLIFVADGYFSSIMAFPSITTEYEIDVGIVSLFCLTFFFQIFLYLFAFFLKFILICFTL